MKACEHWAQSAGLVEVSVMPAGASWCQTWLEKQSLLSWLRTSKPLLTQWVSVANLLANNLFLPPMKLTSKSFCLCSSFTYSSWTPAFATPFNDTTANKSYLIPFCQGYKLLRM